MRRVVLTLLATLALVVGSGAVPASAGDAHFGHNVRRDGVLRHGCHDYRYRYVLKPHAEDWYVEIFIVGPRGKTLGNDLFQKGDRPKRGHGHFKLCRSTTRPGIFKIKTKIHRSHTVCSTPATCTSEEFDRVWIKPARFRLRRP